MSRSFWKGVDSVASSPDTFEDGIWEVFRSQAATREITPTRKDLGMMTPRGSSVLSLSFLLIFQFFTTCTRAVSEVSEFSLPNLVTISSIDELSNGWIRSGDTEYDEGRIILTPKPKHIVRKDEAGTQLGSIWSSQSPSTTLDAFTLELTVRSLGSFGLTKAGLSLFLVDESSVNLEQSDNFGGPSVFKGLQLLLNMDEKLGPVLRVYLNEGKTLNIDTDYLGAYRYEYQGSHVPLTMKVAYENRFLKVTCDNKLLFQTDKVNLAGLLTGRLRLGITASSPKNLKFHEQFEILKLTSYDSATADMKDENDETLVAKHVDSLESRDKVSAAKFLQQQQKLRKKLTSHRPESNSGSTPLTQSTDFELQSIRSSLDFIGNLVEKNDQTKLLQEFATLSKTLETLSQNVVLLREQLGTLNNKYNDLSNMFRKQFDLLDNYDTSLRSFDKVLQSQLKSSDNLDSKLSTLSSYYSNTIKENSNSDLGDTDSLSKLKSLIYMIFLPLLALLALVALWIHRLRNDIKHSKVL